MTQKQLSLFATKIKKASGQDVEEVMAELSNVHLQVKYVDFLKSLDFVPSAWYSDDEAKNHPTAEQIAQEQEAERKAKAERVKQAKKAQEAQKQAQKQAEEQAEQAFILSFESLPIDEQERILDEVAHAIPYAFKKGFIISKEQNQAHKMPMYRQFFKQAMGMI